MKTQKNTLNSINVYSYNPQLSHTDELHKLADLWRKDKLFWPPHEILQSLELSSTHLFYAAVDQAAAWQGLCLWQTQDTAAELLFIFVEPHSRQQNIAAKILHASLQQLSSSPQELYLEVGASNVAAQNLYQKLGFALYGQRQSYYANGEDAHLYKLAPL